MSQPETSRYSRRMLALSFVLCTVLLPLAQAGLGYLAVRASWPWAWLVGTPLGYLLVVGIVAFFATGGLTPAQARSRGTQIGALGGGGGAFVATLILAAIIIRALNAPQPPPSHLSPGGPAFLFLVTLFFLVPAFLGVNLLGIALAALGGMLGGFLRARAQRADQPMHESPEEQERTRTWVVAIVVAVALGILGVAAALVLTSAAFP